MKALDNFFEQLNEQPLLIEFADTMAVIDTHYTYSPSAFSNGDVYNAKDQNAGSCKIFAFGLINKLSVKQTLACFGSYYRDEVLKQPIGDNHANIRSFMRTGWDGVSFVTMPLTLVSKT